MKNSRLTILFFVAILALIFSFLLNVSLGSVSIYPDEILEGLI
ncbi:MAG: iron complex transport system permease protein, partial [Planctomycetota bacterium]